MNNTSDEICNIKFDEMYDFVKDKNGEPEEVGSSTFGIVLEIKKDGSTDINNEHLALKTVKLISKDNEEYGIDNLKKIKFCIEKEIKILYQLSQKFNGNLAEKHIISFQNSVTCQHHIHPEFNKCIETEKDIKSIFTSGFPAFVMPKGQNLNTYIAKLVNSLSNTPLILSFNFIRWCFQIATAIKAVHSIKDNKNNVYVYRDLKNSNLVIIDTSVYLIDFGGAKKLTSESTNSHLFTSNWYVPEFIIPITKKYFTENGKEKWDYDYNIKGDLFSIGLIMHWLLNKLLKVNAKLENQDRLHNLITQGGNPIDDADDYKNKIGGLNESKREPQELKKSLLKLFPDLTTGEETFIASSTKSKQVIESQQENITNNVNLNSNLADIIRNGFYQLIEKLLKANPEDRGNDDLLIEELKRLLGMYIHYAVQATMKVDVKSITKEGEKDIVVNIDGYPEWLIKERESWLEIKCNNELFKNVTFTRTEELKSIRATKTISNIMQGEYEIVITLCVEGVVEKIYSDIINIYLEECPVCDKEIKKNILFCPQCGWSLILSSNTVGIADGECEKQLTTAINIAKKTWEAHSKKLSKLLWDFLPFISLKITLIDKELCFQTDKLEDLLQCTIQEILEQSIEQLFIESSEPENASTLNESFSLFLEEETTSIIIKFDGVGDKNYTITDNNTRLKNSLNQTLQHKLEETLEYTVKNTPDFFTNVVGSGQQKTIKNKEETINDREGSIKILEQTIKSLKQINECDDRTIKRQQEDIELKQNSMKEQNKRIKYQKKELELKQNTIKEQEKEIASKKNITKSKLYLLVICVFLLIALNVGLITKDYYGELISIPGQGVITENDISDITEKLSENKKFINSLAQDGRFKGDRGSTGLTGICGPIGPTGKHGPTGPTGERGPTGPIGDRGPIGQTGERGPIGQTGERGPTGQTGDRGPIGQTGDRGPIGPKNTMQKNKVMLYGTQTKEIQNLSNEFVAFTRTTDNYKKSYFSLAPGKSKPLFDSQLNITRWYINSYPFNEISCKNVTIKCENCIFIPR